MPQGKVASLQIEKEGLIPSSLNNLEGSLSVLNDRLCDLTARLSAGGVLNLDVKEESPETARSQLSVPLAERVASCCDRVCAMTEIVNGIFEDLEI